MRGRQRLKLKQDQRGVVAIEFAIAAPLLALLLVSTVEIGFAARAYFMAADAASVGASYAAHNGWDVPKIRAAIVAASPRMTISAPLTDSPYCGCPQSSGVVDASCGATCSDGLTARRYAKVSTSATRISIFPKATNLPTTVTATAIAQLQ